MAITFLDVQLLFCKNTQKNKISARISEIFMYFCRYILPQKARRAERVGVTFME